MHSSPAQQVWRGGRRLKRNESVISWLIVFLDLVSYPRDRLGRIQMIESVRTEEADECDTQAPKEDRPLPHTYPIKNNKLHDLYQVGEINDF